MQEKNVFIVWSFILRLLSNPKPLLASKMEYLNP